MIAKVTLCAEIHVQWNYKYTSRHMDCASKWNTQKHERNKPSLNPVVITKTIEDYMRIRLGLFSVASEVSCLTGSWNMYIFWKNKMNKNFWQRNYGNWSSRMLCFKDVASISAEVRMCVHCIFILMGRLHREWMGSLIMKAATLWFQSLLATRLLEPKWVLKI